MKEAFLSMQVSKLLDGVASIADWETKRSEIRRKWLDTIGGIPEKVPSLVKILDETVELNHTRVHLTYDTVFGDVVTAYLLVPNNRAQNQILPAIVAAHPTSSIGKAEVATVQGKFDHQYGLELVSRGYVVLAPDTITAGERLKDGQTPYRTEPFYQENPEWSAVAKMIVDHSQGIDVLCSFPFVDPSRIGAIGHSLGGYNAYFLAAMDDRIRAVVCSGGFGMFAGDPEPHHWGLRDWFSHIPEISRMVDRGQLPPFEFHEIAALLAPVPFLNWSAQEDRFFPNWQQIGMAMIELSGLYRFLGAEERFVSILGDGGHRFPGWVRSVAYDFLDRWLKKETI
ncbi:alpha/beta hydrolase family protein [Paenibacillus koleovorans]|uniref:alpha/beta hydrolase family protein n=1 Tax=Paenibacillus koleovorans TaxID=121608 RepID=UPI000FD7ADD0|nr:alpha/beta fold hydrolase [Paenibacillus koleovorans]